MQIGKLWLKLKREFFLTNAFACPLFLGAGVNSSINFLLYKPLSCFCAQTDYDSPVYVGISRNRPVSLLNHFSFNPFVIFQVSLFFKNYGFTKMLVSDSRQSVKISNIPELWFLVLIITVVWCEMLLVITIVRL